MLLQVRSHICIHVQPLHANSPFSRYLHVSLFSASFNYTDWVLLGISKHMHSILTPACAFMSVTAAGLNGLMDSVEPGLACGSDTSHMNILGYDPRR